MGRPFYKKKRGFADSILRYGFAAAIEITNALVDSSEKSDQAKLAKSYLEKITEGDARIAAGIAYNGNWVDPGDIHGLDFLIDLAEYNPERLECVADEMLGSRYLTGKDKSLLRKILGGYCPEMPLAGFFAFSNMAECAERLGTDIKEYQHRLPDLKGLCMELYIRSVFDDELDDKVIIHRHKFAYRPTHNGPAVQSETDNIIICGQMDFYGALQRLGASKDFTAWINPASLELTACPQQSYQKLSRNCR